jgi:hypothetical protein
MKDKNELRKILIGAFLQNRDRHTVAEFDGEGLFKEVYRFYILLTQMKLKRGQNIMLVGKADDGWIAVYLAAILKGVDVFIMPQGMNETDITWYANRYNTKVMFITEGSKSLFRSPDSFRKLINTNAVFSLWDYSFSKCRINIANEIFGLDAVIRLADIDFSMAITKVTEDISTLRHSSSVYSLTSGIESAYPKVVENTTDTLWEAVSSFELDLEDTEVSMANPEKYHVITVLYPIIYGKEIFTDGYTMYRENVIFDVPAFRKFWSELMAQVPPRGLNKYKFFRDLAIGRRLRRYLKKVIIVNADLPSEWIKLLYKNCELITTYGMEETSHITAYNNYSNRVLKQPHCIGVVCNSEIEVHDESIVAPHLFKSYAWDEEATRLLKPRHDLVRTNDKISTKLVKGKPYIFFKGRNIDFIDRIAYGKFEQEINASPLVKYCVIADDPREDRIGKVLVINPDFGYTTSSGLGLVGLRALFLDKIGRLNLKLGKEIIKDVVIQTDDIQLTYDQKVKAYFYRGEDSVEPLMN